MGSGLRDAEAYSLSDEGIMAAADIWKSIEDATEPGEGTSKAAEVVGRIYRLGARAMGEAVKGKAWVDPERLERPVVDVEDIDALMKEVGDDRPGQS